MKRILREAQRIRMSHKLLLAIELVLGVLIASTASAGPAAAYVPTNLRQVAIGEDLFYNYDFQNTTTSDVDWPINLLFTNNAEIDAVKNDIYWGEAGILEAGPMNMRLSDDGGIYGFHWDSDKGTKWPTEGSTEDCLDPTNWDTDFLHARLYADNGDDPITQGDEDQLYNLQLGFYVIASSHWDGDECRAFPGIPGDALYGNNESAEASFAETAEQNCSTCDAERTRIGVDFGNLIYHVEGNHLFDNDGRATRVCVFTPGTVNSDWQHMPGSDRLRDVCDPDDDGDGASDSYELAISENPVAYCQVMRSDPNGSGSVSLGDIGYVIARWSQAGSIPDIVDARWDINGNGNTDLFDLGLVAGYWGLGVLGCA